MGAVYTITHKTTKRVYVGQTSKDPTSRLKDHCTNPHLGTAVGRAMVEEGTRMFEFRVIRDGLTSLEAKKVELDYIDFFRSTDPQYGYNGKKGGVAKRRKWTLEDLIQDGKYAVGTKYKEELKNAEK